MKTPHVLSALIALSLSAACSGRPAATATAKLPDTSLPALAVGHPGVGSPATAASGETTAMQADKDVTTVADLWKTRTALAGKKVTLRGKVVKFNGGILGVNWIHLQDGSGNAADGTNDITVTSESEAKVGEVITVTGTVVIDKDLGSGYNYPVIIEQATIGRAADAIR